MRYLATFFLIAAFIFALPLAANAEFNTIDDLAKAYSDETCKGCHAKIYDEWKKSYHSQSTIHSLGGIRNFVAVGIQKEWDRPINKKDLMKCFHCHAPQLSQASDELAVKIGKLIVAAVDEKDEAKKAAAKKELEKLNVGCVICHNTIVNRPAIASLGVPEKDAMYGPAEVSAPHKTMKSNIIKESVFCGQCHGIYNPPDSDLIMCNTLYDSYLNTYTPYGGQQTCQDCHMKEKNRGHTFPGAYVADIVKEGIEVTADATGYKHLTGTKWVPRIIVTADIYNKSGHRTPDG
ncbi:MAG: multiheme c-type cytochrome ExtKL [Nitrospiraceae bacterium]|nr:multiheme c-type cytochrome ExtKL [Nitrospiraceae bacterium]